MTDQVSWLKNGCSTCSELIRSKNASSASLNNSVTEPDIDVRPLN